MKKKSQLSPELAETVEEKQINVEQLEDSPLAIIDNGEDFAVDYAGYRISEIFKSRQECIDYLKEKPWRVIISIAQITVQQMTKKD